MAWSKAYARITWVNEPSTDTPLNATNLNKMDLALNEIDNRVLQLQGSAYVHIKYSAYAAPTNIQMSDTPNVYMGICVTSEETAPTQASTYTWNRVRGEKVMLQAADGYIQWKYESDASWTNIVALSTLKGEQGDTGEKGETGAAFTYADFTPQQLAALKGAAGADGADGDDGRGIVSVTRTNGTGAAGTTDTYTIAYTDSTSSVFYVYNGADGLGTGDMLKSAYDTNDNGVVDNAEKLGGQLPSYYAIAADIPNITGKADKVTTATEGNLAGLDSGGNLVDSGKKATDFAAASDIPDISGKLDKSGGTMTGALTLSGDPTDNLHAATKKYVDDNSSTTTVVDNLTSTSTTSALSAAQGKILQDGKLNLSGGTMTGQLVAKANTAYTTYQVRNIALSTSAALPTGNGSLLGVYS